ncbi:MAG: tRNA (adenosine(37)-N6)-threonylcarbamoyltransferase complex dimerization subunit type 1 TsaB [Ignavibacteria bacterium]|nr:tRNA (adenosine(37)-N6)-threonylcarbamoyltransferase complex dimerization subunit type 1 TsaB [Ignavibacteria bacterium]
MAVEKDDKRDDIVIFNPTVLAIDTTTTNCSVALLKGNEIVAEYSVFIPNIHDYILAELVRRILQDSKINFDKLDYIAVSSGPGSFTGLRIGASLAKGICFDDNIKLISVPTLFSLAFAAKSFLNGLEFSRIVVLIHSHKDLYYSQFFSLELEPISKVELLDKNSIGDKLSDSDVVCGDPKIIFSKGLNYGKLFYPSAKFVAFSSLEMMKSGKWTSSQNFVPEYYQDFVPKVGKKN